MTVLAEFARGLRPDAWHLPLFLHILGAMVLVGSLVLAVTALAAAWRAADGTAAVRLGYRALLVGAIPSWFVMRVAAQWIYSQEGFDKKGVTAPSWIDIGFSTSEGGLLLIIIATVLAGLSARRGRSGTGVRIAAVLASLLVVVYLVTVWAMTTKPV